MTVARTGWQFWIDRGGTFTDIVARAPDGTLHTSKLLSEAPSRYADAAIEGIRRFHDAAEDGFRIDSVKMGTTVATNALLERTGEPTVLLITAGLADVIRIGTQQRPDIFAIDIRLPEMLYEAVIEVRERIASNGECVQPLDERKLESDLLRHHERGFRSAAIVLMHGYRFPEHECRVAEIARRVGFEQISLSHRVSPTLKIVPRGDTTLVDAYLTPVLHRYVDSVRRGIDSLGGAGQLFFMQSHGGLTGAEGFHGSDSVLSGPAGGVVGMARTAEIAGFDRVIGFDMGGTSTDVALFDGAYQRTDSTVVDGIRITAPMMKIQTVAAGGGSIITYRQQRLQVGPGSAGAVPGPACYRNGGPLTVTDANVLLGRIPVDRFPRVFGPTGDMPIDTESVRREFVRLAASISAEAGAASSPEEVAVGALRIAVERMANAIKQISVKQGRELREFSLCCFGGAGGQHACLVADALGIESIFVHPHSGVLSAYGMGLADIRVVLRETVEMPLDHGGVARCEELAAKLELRAQDDMRRQGIDQAAERREIRVHLKAAGTDTSIPIDTSWPLSIERLAANFEHAHAVHYGFCADPAAIVIAALELELVAEMPKIVLAPRLPEIPVPPPLGQKPLWTAGEWVDAPIFERSALPGGARLDGPAILVENNATVVVDPGWRCRVDTAGNLIIERRHIPQQTPPIALADASQPDASQPDPILLEVFNNAFMHAAQQMGIVLENAAHSVNIKERLDFSCAIFDRDGDLIANAPHMPVHLGSMGDSVRQVLSTNAGTLRVGDTYMTNAPYNGGTHLPDITVVTPMFGADGTDWHFVLACRAHHADVGGVSPGSMPPLSRSIREEGIVIDSVRIVADGQFRDADTLALFRHGRYPARNPAQNVADLKAQVAANARGIAELQRMIQRFGFATVTRYMAHIKRNAELSVRAVISDVHDGSWVTELDSGERISVAIRVDSATQAVTVDLTGSSPTSSGNFNAPSAIAKSAALYAFRALIRADIPLNAGCLTPITVVLPQDSIVNPAYPAAVVAGNVETSQCITDAIFAALGMLGSSQGTMNNFTFGNNRYQYYETLCGGAGASRTCDGASAVHTHMTNSKLTDPEVLELRYPVRVRRFSIAKGTGGQGARVGGDGVIRDIEFLEAMDAAILSNRRIVPPFGIAGGQPGKCGKNYVIRADGRVEKLAGVAGVAMNAGDRFVIETPGGGGFGG